MIHFVGDENQNIKEIQYCFQLKHHDFAYTWQTVDHEQIAEQIKDLQVCSVITLRNQLAEEHYQDPKYMIQTNHLCVSEVQEEARRRLCNSYYTGTEIDDILKKYDIQKTAGNNATDEQHSSFYSRLCDSIFTSQEHQLFKEILEEKREQCRYSYDDNDDEILLTDEQLEKVWQEEIVKITLPRVITEYNRVYSVPEPFDHWDYRNSWQQFFFITDVEKQCIKYARGGWGSSGARESHGRFAHIFATLTKKYSRNINTYVALYDEHNNFKLLTTFDTLKVIGYNLTGNYPADYKQLDVLFDGLKILPDNFREFHLI